MTRPEQPAAEPYDFRRPTTLAREHSRVLELAFETFARQWATQLTATIRARSTVTFEQVTMSTYDEYAAALPAQTTMVLCGIGDETAKAAVQFPSASALSWFSFMLGGSGAHSEPERTFTALEQSLLSKVVTDLLDALMYSLGSLLTSELRFETVSHNSQFAQAASTGELMVIAVFEVQTGEQTSRATLAIPAEVILRRLGEANPIADVAGAQDLVHAQMATVPVEVALQIPTVPITPGQLLALTEGDLIPLRHPANRPIELAIGGLPIAHAAAAAVGTRLALTVTDTKDNA